MKTYFTILIGTLLSIYTFGQNNLDVIGKVKVSDMEVKNSADSIVVRLNDGTLAIRELNSISSGFYLGQDTLGGIVGHVYEGNDGKDHGIVISAIEIVTQWQSTRSLTNSDRTWDGQYNSNLMIDSPAISWISTNFSSEWFLPSIEELEKVWQNILHINEGLFNIGSQTIPLNAGNYWSSTEAHEDFAYVYDSSDRNIGNAMVKTYNFRVRAIRKF